MKNKTNKALRERRHARVRSRIKGTSARPRLAVFKSNRFVSVQLIDDTKGITIAAAHGRAVSGTQPRRQKSGPRPVAASGSVQALAVGEAIAKAAKALGIEKVVFDRGGYRYGGHVKTLADAARTGGLTF